MLTQQTLEKMNEMKMSAMAEAFEQQLGSGEHAKLSFEERVGLLVDCEWSAREQRKLTRRLRAAKPRCGPLRDRQKSIFDRDADAMRSAAFVPLGAGAGLGFLIIGSRDPEHFHPGKRTDFLVRLGDLVAAALRPE